MLISSGILQITGPKWRRKKFKLKTDLSVSTNKKLLKKEVTKTFSNMSEPQKCASVDHIKGAFHYALGDNMSTYQVLKSAGRFTAVMFGGVGAFSVGGPVGAAVGAIAAGTAFDSALTIADSAAADKFKPSGVFTVLSDTNDTDKWWSAATTLAGDGVTGYVAGTAASPNLTKVVGSNGKSTTIQNIRGIAYVREGWFSPATAYNTYQRIVTFSKTRFTKVPPF